MTLQHQDRYRPHRYTTTTIAVAAAAAAEAGAAVRGLYIVLRCADLSAHVVHLVVRGRVRPTGSLTREARRHVSMFPVGRWLDSEAGSRTDKPATSREHVSHSAMHMSTYLLIHKSCQYTCQHTRQHTLPGHLAIQRTEYCVVSSCCCRGATSFSTSFVALLKRLMPMSVWRQTV